MEGLQQGVRKTNEHPRRVAVYDVIALLKKCDNNYAGQLYSRLLQEQKVPKCEKVGQDLIHANSINQDFGHGGGNRKKVRVATAQEMVQIMWALPGETAFKKNCADVVVR